MSHYDQIKSLIKPYIGEETKVFPKFLHYLLSDPKYGSINHTNEPKSIKAIQGVIDLYKEWIDTGIKPSEDIWLKARELAWKAWNASAAAYAAYAADATNADSAAYAAAASAAYAAAYAAHAAARAAYDAASASTIPRSEVEKAQLDKLNDLIRTKGEDEDDGLYSWEDYEKG